MKKQRVPLYMLQYELTDADFSHVYAIYLKKERLEEKQSAVLISLIAIAAAVALSLAFGFRKSYLVYAGLVIVFCIAHICIPANIRFVKQHQTLYGSKHTLQLYENSVFVEERQEDNAEYEDAGGNVFEMENISVYESEDLFLIYKGCIHDFFEPIPKLMLSDSECTELRNFFQSHLGKKYKKIITTERKQPNE